MAVGFLGQSPTSEDIRQITLLSACFQSITSEAFRLSHCPWTRNSRKLETFPKAPQLLILARECRDRRVTRETRKTRFLDWPRRGCVPEPEHRCPTFPPIPSGIKSTCHGSECQGSHSVAHYNVGLLPAARGAIAAPFRCVRRSSYLQLGHLKREARPRWLCPRVWDLLLEPRTRSQYSSTVSPNGTFPGPTFAVNKGDSVVIHTHNKLTSPDMRRSTSIVWCPPVGCLRHF